MNCNRKIALLRALGTGLFALAAVSCAREQPVSFTNDVKPVLDQYCVECHQPGGAGYAASGLDLTSYAGVMRGTRNGPMVVPGDSMGSNLIVLMEGRADPSLKMPHGTRTKVRVAEIDAISAWIDQGAKNN